MHTVIPTKAEIYGILDSRLRGNDNAWGGRRV